MVSSPTDASFFFAMFTRGATGIDELLSKHIAHLFMRDPIVIFSELVDQDDSKSTDHFEVCFNLATSSRDKVIPTSRKLTLVVLGEYRLIRTSIGRNSATESIKLNSKASHIFKLKR